MNKIPACYRFWTSIPCFVNESDIVLGEVGQIYILREEETDQELQVTMHLGEKGEKGWSIAINVPRSSDRIFPLEAIMEVKNLMLNLGPAILREFRAIDTAFNEFDWTILTDDQEQRLRENLDAVTLNFDSIAFYGLLTDEGILSLEVEPARRAFPLPAGSTLEERVTRFIAQILATPPSREPVV